MIEKKNQNMDDRRRDAKKFASSSYTTSLMSNAKWRTLFLTLEARGVDIRGMTVKFVGDDNVWGPVHPSLSPATEYIDLWPLNVYPLVEIEWVEFPRTVVTKRPNNVPAKLEPQDIDTIRTVLVGTGKQFPLEVSYDAIRVLGHTK